MSQILILVFEPFKPSYLRRIDNTLEAMQGVLGGNYEEVYLGIDDMVLVCNEEGRLLNLPHDRGFFGTFFLAGVDTGHTISIPSYRIEEARQIFEHRGNYESQSESLSVYFTQTKIPYKMFDYEFKQRKTFIDTPTIVEFILNLHDPNELKEMEERIRQLELAHDDILDLLKEIGLRIAEQQELLYERERP